MTSLDDLYAQVPDTGCKGLCAAYCGPIAMAPAEQARIEERHGLRMEPGATHPGTLTCIALTHGQCSVYADRPMICRLWGSVEGMPCPHGCRPTFGLMPDAVGGHLLQQAMDAT